MKRNLQTLTTLFICFLSFQFTMAQSQASVNSSYPQPYPDSYSGMTDFFNDPLTNPDCGGTAFDLDCINALRSACNNDNALCCNNSSGNCATAEPLETDCCIEQLSDNPAFSNFGACSNLPLPFCNIGSPCASYSSSTPPPGYDPPFGADGILVEIINYDGYCCTDQDFVSGEWDMLCQSHLDSIAIKICSDNDPMTTDGASPLLGCTHTPIAPGSFTADAIVKLKTMLEGAYDTATNVMLTKLRDNDLLPVAQPFNQAPWNYAGSESVSAVSDLPANMVDWILVQLVDPINYTNIVGETAAILLSDGSIVAHDGSTTDHIKFSGIDLNTNYYVILRSRNYVDVMSAMPIYVSSLATYDFTVNDGFSQGYSLDFADGTGQMVIVDFGTLAIGDEVYAMRSGDLNGDGSIGVLDINQFLSENASVNGYKASDLNYDGNVTVEDYNLLIGTFDLNVVGYSAIQL
ncbi:MAG: hypothetical protein ACPGXL_02020 [Chitinophagales bacterium]